jgi:hypothetical protein
VDYAGTGTSRCTCGNASLWRAPTTAVGQSARVPTVSVRSSDETTTKQQQLKMRRQQTNTMTPTPRTHIWSPHPTHTPHSHTRARARAPALTRTRPNTPDRPHPLRSIEGPTLTHTHAGEAQQPRHLLPHLLQFAPQHPRPPPVEQQLRPQPECHHRHQVTPHPRPHVHRPQDADATPQERATRPRLSRTDGAVRPEVRLLCAMGTWSQWIYTPRGCRGNSTRGPRYTCWCQRC